MFRVEKKIKRKSEKLVSLTVGLIKKISLYKRKKFV